MFQVPKYFSIFELSELCWNFKPLAWLQLPNSNVILAGCFCKILRFCSNHSAKHSNHSHWNQMLKSCLSMSTKKNCANGIFGNIVRSGQISPQIASDQMMFHQNRETSMQKISVMVSNIYDVRICRRCWHHCWAHTWIATFSLRHFINRQQNAAMKTPFSPF